MVAQSSALHISVSHHSTYWSTCLRYCTGNHFGTSERLRSYEALSKIHNHQHVGKHDVEVQGTKPGLAGGAIVTRTKHRRQVACHIARGKDRPIPYMGGTTPWDPNGREGILRIFSLVGQPFHSKSLSLMNRPFFNDLLITERDPFYR